MLQENRRLFVEALITYFCWLQPAPNRQEWPSVRKQHQPGITRMTIQRMCQPQEAVQP